MPKGIVDLDDEQFSMVRKHMELMEEHIAKFAAFERAGDVDTMTDTLIRITERVAEVRRMYQPDFPAAHVRGDPSRGAGRMG